MTDIALHAANNTEVSVYSRSHLNSEISEFDFEILNKYSTIIVIENHTPCLANFARIKTALESTSTKVIRMGIDAIPANGETQEVLKFHGIDVDSIRNSLSKYIK